MTILDACEKLYSWFSKHDYFQNLNAHFKEICLVSDCMDADKAAILNGLETLKKLDIIIEQKVGEQTFWILKRPYATIEQNVVISAPIANLLAQFTNRFCEAAKDTEHMCDPSNITEKNISFLLYLVNETFKGSSVNNNT